MPAHRATVQIENVLLWFTTIMLRAVRREKLDCGYIYCDSKHIKMQLDVDVSPPANLLIFWLTLTPVTFDLDPSDL